MVLECYGCLRKKLLVASVLQTLASEALVLIFYRRRVLRAIAPGDRRLLFSNSAWAVAVANAGVPIPQALRLLGFKARARSRDLCVATTEIAFKNIVLSKYDAAVQHLPRRPRWLGSDSGLRT